MLLIQITGQGIVNFTIFIFLKSLWLVIVQNDYFTTGFIFVQ